MAKNGKLPKRIAGVKIPKKVRKRGGQLYTVLGSPIVANLVAAGLIAAADAMTRQPPVKKAGKTAKRAAAQAADTAGETTVDVGQILAFAAREAARAIKSNAR